MWPRLHSPFCTAHDARLLCLGARIFFGKHLHTWVNLLLTVSAFGGRCWAVFLPPHIWWMGLKGTVTGKQLLSSQVNLSGCHMREVLFIVSIYLLSIGINHRLNIMENLQHFSWSPSRVAPEQGQLHLMIAFLKGGSYSLLELVKYRKKLAYTYSNSQIWTFQTSRVHF